MKHEIYFSKKTKKYYYIGLMPCEKCNRLIEGLVFIDTIYSNKKKVSRYFCKDCVMKRQQLPQRYNNIMMCIVTDDLPKDSFPVFDAPPVLSNYSGEDVVICATNNHEGERIVDKAFQSHNPNFMTLGKVKSQSELIDEMNKPDDKLSLSDVNFVFREIKKSALLESRFDDEEKERRRLK
jgi:hypothetical protein